VKVGLLLELEALMPRDLFGDVVSRPPSVRSRRTPVVIASIVSHVAILMLLVVTTLVAADALPIPREALEFFEHSIPVDILPPAPPPPPRPVIRQPEAPGTNPNTAPLVAPEGIKPEPPMRELVDSSPVGSVIDGRIGADGIGIGALEPPPPPPPPPAPPTILRVGGAIRAPQKIVNVAPIYPVIAQSAHKEGIVMIEATIDVDGNVVAARVLRREPLLDQAAVDAVRQWKFTPTLLNGVPVPVVMTVTVNFKLN
jgi:TonB family protein